MRNPAATTKECDCTLHMQPLGSSRQKSVVRGKLIVNCRPLNATISWYCLLFRHWDIDGPFLWTRSLFLFEMYRRRQTGCWVVSTLPKYTNKDLIVSMFVIVTGTDNVQPVTTSRFKQIDSHPLLVAAVTLPTSEEQHVSKYERKS